MDDGCVSQHTLHRLGIIYVKITILVRKTEAYLKTPQLATQKWAVKCLWTVNEIWHLILCQHCENKQITKQNSCNIFNFVIEIEQ